MFNEVPDLGDAFPPEMLSLPEDQIAGLIANLRSNSLASSAVKMMAKIRGVDSEMIDTFLGNSIPPAACARLVTLWKTYGVGEPLTNAMRDDPIIGPLGLVP